MAPKSFLRCNPSLQNPRDPTLIWKDIVLHPFQSWTQLLSAVLTNDATLFFSGEAFRRHEVEKTIPKLQFFGWTYPLNKPQMHYCHALEISSRVHFV